MWNVANRHYLHVLSLEMQAFFADPLIEIIILQEGFLHHAPSMENSALIWMFNKEEYECTLQKHWHPQFKF